jgi:hypothetical protein
VLLVLSGESGLAPALSRLADAQEPVVALPDCPAAAGALQAARQAIPSLRAEEGSDPAAARSLLDRADRIVAPSLDLTLASRVAAMHAESPGSRVILGALLRGIPVEATLDERDFAVSPRAHAGARRAIGEIERRLRDLGIALTPAAEPDHQPLSPTALGAGRPHPSQERFELPGSLDEFVDFLESKACVIEPGKPCVRCGACETRGF